SGITRHDYYPFGEENLSGAERVGNGYQADGVRQKFDGYERDNETGLDFAQARYFSNTQGRFTSPDIFFGRKTNPQTLNRYAYVLNNPLKWTDPTGYLAQDPIKVGEIDRVEIVDRLPEETEKRRGFFSRLLGGLKKIGGAIGTGAKDVGTGLLDIPHQFGHQVSDYYQNPSHFFN